MRNRVRGDYVRVWRKVCLEWLGWPKERFVRFVSAVNGRLAKEDVSIWFYHQPPFYHIIPLLVTSRFETRLHQEVRKGKYGSPEWIYFRSELLDSIEGGRNHATRFSWRAARKRAEEHLALYREKLPPSDAVTDYERFMHTFETSLPS